MSQTVYFHRLPCTVAEVLRDEQGFLDNVYNRLRAVGRQDDSFSKFLRRNAWRRRNPVTARPTLFLFHQAAKKLGNQTASG